MNKSEVCVKLTRKNCKKVLEILEMFGEKCPYNLSDQMNLQTGVFRFSFNGAYWCVRGSITELTPIKPRELRNILAKEHLKAGDVVVVNNSMHKKGWVIEFSGWGKNRFGKDIVMYSKAVILLDNDSLFANQEANSYIANPNFRRYATDEEKALLEPKITIVTLNPVATFTGYVPGQTTYTREVWVNHYSDQEFHVHATKEAADLSAHLNGNLGKHCQTVKGTLTYDTPMTKV